jgi:hypothetical protein
MVLTVCDVAATPGMTPPPDVNPPSQDSPLFGYIVARLIDSFDLPHVGFMKYYDWMITPDHDTGWPPFFIRRGLAWKTIVDEWPNSIRPELDAGRLCPLGLVTLASVDPRQLGQNHQVLAYGYDLDDALNLSLLIYDPNTSQAAADSVRIAFSLADPSNTTPISHNVGVGHPVRGLFRVPYRYNNPTGLQAPPPVTLAPTHAPTQPYAFAVRSVAEGELPARRLLVAVKPRRIKGNTPISMTVQATDAQTGKPVVGSVYIGDALVGTTGVPFAYTFFKTPAPAGRTRGRGASRAKSGGTRSANAAPASGHVIVPGYLPGYVEFNVS